MAKQLNSYELSRAWFDWCFENPEKVTPNHSALYFFCIEHCNRLGWKPKFGLPTTMAMEAIGIKSYNTYIKTFNNLIDWGFIMLIEKSRNQYSANIVALSNNDKAVTKALDKALIKHSTKQLPKQGESTVQSNSSVSKQDNNKPINNKQDNNIDSRKLKFANSLLPFIEVYGKETIKEFYEYWTEDNKSKTKFKMELQKTWDSKKRLERWTKNDYNKNNNNGEQTNTDAILKWGDDYLKKD